MRAVRLAGAAEGRLDAPLRPREAAPVLQGAGPAVRSALSRCVDQSWRGLVGTPSQERDSDCLRVRRGAATPETWGRKGQKTCLRFGFSSFKLALVLRRSCPSCVL